MNPTMPPVDNDLHLLLAKSQPRESLVTHTWHVLCRLAELRRLHPNLALETGSPRFWHQVYLGIFLHDFGKAADGFQEVMRGRKRVWGFRHEALSLAFVEWLFSRDDPDYAPVVAIIATHHRDANDIIGHYKENTADPDEDNAKHLVAQLKPQNIRRLYDWLVKSGAEWADALGFGDIEIPPLPPFETALAQIKPKAVHHAITTLKRYTTDLSFSEDKLLALGGALLRGLVLTADHAGSAWSTEPGRSFLPISLTHEQVARSLDKPHLFPHQDAAAKAPSGSMLLISPTSSGKTEAALFWLAQQEIHDGQPAARVFYTLPYQASMNAMQSRLEQFFPKEAVGLQHSRMLQSLYFRTLTSSDDPNLTAEFAHQQRELAKLHYYPVNIVSPYHLLKVPYQLKGFEALLTHFYGGRFILDEIHAYEPQRMALILSMLRFLHQVCHGRFFIMTATLAPHIREALYAALPDLHLITATPQTFQRFQRHCVHVLEHDLLHPTNITRIVADAAHQSVLVCCNTVQRAFEVADTLRTALEAAYENDAPEVILIHSRFNGQDRSRIEKSIICRTGVGEKRQPTVVVATQVIEVSLNIDLDTLYSEAAPLEALLQRFGRVNRGRPVGSPLADVYVVSEQPEVVKHIYSLLLINAALDCLKAADNMPIDEGLVGDWLAQVYAGEALADWQTAYESSRQEFESAIMNHLSPFNSGGFDELFYRMFDGVDVLPEQFFEEYEGLIGRGEYIAASALLVPIGWSQYKRLKGRIWMERKVADLDKQLFVIQAPYSSESGLDLSDKLDSTGMEAD